MADTRGTDIGISTFFESLKSTRRLCLLDEILSGLARRMHTTIPDGFAAFPSLANFDLIAGDGHFIAASCHDKKMILHQRKSYLPHNGVQPQKIPPATSTPSIRAPVSSIT